MALKEDSPDYWPPEDVWCFDSFEETIKDYNTKFPKKKFRNFWSWEAFAKEYKITKDKVQKIKKTINLTGKDDSPMVIASEVAKSLRKKSSYRHIVELTFLEWATMPQESKLNFLRWMLESHPIPWAVNEVDHQKEMCTYRLAFPTLADL